MKNLGLILGAIAVAPLVAAALVWSCLLLILGEVWLLHLFGLA